MPLYVLPADSVHYFTYYSLGHAVLFGEVDLSGVVEHAPLVADCDHVSIGQFCARLRHSAARVVLGTSLFALGHGLSLRYVYVTICGVGWC